MEKTTKIAMFQKRIILECRTVAPRFSDDEENDAYGNISNGLEISDYDDYDILMIHEETKSCIDTYNKSDLEH